MATSSHYLFFDTETTGIPRNFKAPASDVDNWPRLVQLSWILMDEEGNRLHEGDYIIRPQGYTIPSAVSKIHGITTERALAEGHDIVEVLDLFSADLKQAQFVVGHNVQFDQNIVGAELIRLNRPNALARKKRLCTMLASVDLCAIPGRFGYKYPKLQELHQTLFGHGFEDAHNAHSDSEATQKCFWELRRRGEI
jgi:DNA polymerase III epsilon subunit-like protein